MSAPSGAAARDTERVLVWERMLEDGTRAELARWIGGPPGGKAAVEIVGWLRANGDRLSARSWAFWAWLVADLPGTGKTLPPRGDNPYWPDAAGRDATDAGDAA